MSKVVKSTVLKTGKGFPWPVFAVFLTTELLWPGTEHLHISVRGADNKYTQSKNATLQTSPLSRYNMKCDLSAVFYHSLFCTAYSLVNVTEGDLQVSECLYWGQPREWRAVLSDFSGLLLSGGWLRKPVSDGGLRWKSDGGLSKDMKGLQSPFCKIKIIKGKVWTDSN